MKALSLAPFNYILEEDKGSGSPTTFRLRPLDGIEMLDLSNVSAASTDSDVIRHVLNIGLVGWDGLQGDGGPVKFSANQEDNIRVLTVDAMAELVDVIMGKSKLSKEQVKN